MFKFDGDGWCVVHCQPNSRVVQMTSNIANAEVATMIAASIREQGGHIFRIIPANVLIAALELVKKQEHENATKCDKCGDKLTGHEDDSSTRCRWCVQCVESPAAIANAKPQGKK